MKMSSRGTPLSLIPWPTSCSFPSYPIRPQNLLVLFFATTHRRSCDLLAKTMHCKRDMGTLQCCVDVTISVLESERDCLAYLTRFRSPSACISYQRKPPRPAETSACIVPSPTAGIWAPVLSLKCVGRAILIVVRDDGGGRPKWMDPWLYAPRLMSTETYRSHSLKEVFPTDRVQFGPSFTEILAG
jgi:hypothetical protein